LEVAAIIARMGVRSSLARQRNPKRSLEEKGNTTVA
jgi:hypothetical protein